MWPVVYQADNQCFLVFRVPVTPQTGLTLPTEGSGHRFSLFSCVDSDDEDCSEQFSGSLIDARLMTAVYNESSNRRVTDYLDKATVDDDDVELSASKAASKREEAGPSNATSTTRISAPTPDQMPRASTSSSTNIANLRIHTTLSNVRVSTAIAGRRGEPFNHNVSDPSKGSSTEGEGKGHEQQEQMTSPLRRNVVLIVGVASGVLLLLAAISFAVFKYRSRDEGTYKIDNRNYTYEVCSSRTEENGGGGGAYKLRSIKSKQKRKDTKEWYV